MAFTSRATEVEVAVRIICGASQTEHRKQKSNELDAISRVSARCTSIPLRLRLAIAHRCSLHCYVYTDYEKRMLKKESI